MGVGVSDTIEDYIVTIYRLEEVFGYARTTHIARELKVRPATVTKIVGRLQKRGYALSIKYRDIRLTREGRRIAEDVIRKHRIAEVYLTRVLGFDAYESHRLAHYLEHMPDILTSRMYEKLGKPKLCPHGNPIPGADVKVEDESISLADAPEGRRYTIVRIAGELNSAMEALSRSGLKIGDNVEVIENSGREVTLRLESGEAVRFDPLVAAAVKVREAGKASQ